MPIEHEIDLPRRRISARVTGTLTDPEIFAYQREVWSRPEVQGFDELVDMTAADHVAVPSTARVQELAQVSARSDPPAGSARMAIVAPQDLAYGLGRMYQTFRALDAASTKEVRVFRS